MKIRLRGKTSAGSSAPTPTAGTDASAPSGLQRNVSQRRGFLKLLATGAGVLGATGLGQVALPARKVSATTISDDLTVQGNNISLGALGANATLHFNDIYDRFTIGRSGSALLIQALPWDGSIQLVTSNSTGTYKSVMAANGNVGIGTTSPGNYLDILGNQGVVSQGVV